MTETAKIVAHSRIDNAPDIVTVECVFPRIILPELNTYSSIKRSLQSSRAVPVKRLIEALLADPYIPNVFRKNIAGMSGGDPLEDQETARSVYIEGMRNAIKTAQRLSDLGVAKEDANRGLESYVHVSAVLTATNWDHMFRQRLNLINPRDKAQPSFTRLAQAIKDAIEASEPRTLRFGSWHLPYFDWGKIPKRTITDSETVNVSAAVCARQSYLTRPQADEFDYDKDTALANRLISDEHWGPFEHQAREWQHGDPDNANRNLAQGWSQARALVGG